MEHSRFQNLLTAGGLGVSARLVHVKQGVHDSTHLSPQNHTLTVDDRHDGSYLVHFELHGAGGKNKEQFTCFPIEVTSHNIIIPRASHTQGAVHVLPHRGNIT